MQDRVTKDSFLVDYGATMKQEQILNPGFEVAINEKAHELIRNYVPGPFFENWLNGCKASFKRYEWDSEMSREKTMSGCFFWVECLLKTWREEIGPPRKPAPSFKGQKFGFRGDFGP
jgi:hypothetical protein